MDDEERGIATDEEFDSVGSEKKSGKWLIGLLMIAVLVFLFVLGFHNQIFCLYEDLFGVLGGPDPTVFPDEYSGLYDIMIHLFS